MEYVPIFSEGTPTVSQQEYMAPKGSRICMPPVLALQNSMLVESSAIPPRRYLRSFSVTRSSGTPTCLICLLPQEQPGEHPSVSFTSSLAGLLLALFICPPVHEQLEAHRSIFSFSS